MSNSFVRRVLRQYRLWSWIGTLLIVLVIVSLHEVAAAQRELVNGQNQSAKLIKNSASKFVSKKFEARTGTMAQQPKFFLDEVGIGEYDIIASAVQSYLTVNGPEAFLEEIYNLLGNRPFIKIDTSNVELAIAFGVPGAVCLDIDEKVESTAPTSFFNENRIAILHNLSRLFADSRVGQNLPEHQRYFLEWHFGSEAMYRRNLRKAGRAGVVGWNSALYVSGSDDFALYTFGLIGCTAIIAEADDGSTLMAHTEGDGRNAENHLARIRKTLALFSNSRKIIRLRTLGYHARAWAEFLQRDFKETHDIGWLQPSGGPVSHANTVRFRRHKGTISIDYQHRPLGDNYLGSIYPNLREFNVNLANGERWPDFGYAGGRASLIFPLAKLDFIKAVFRPLE